jgi:L-gulonolactone oxidase
MTRPWTNWARTARCTPAAYAVARDEEDAAVLVRAARHRGLPVRAVGAGHSFAPLACSSGLLLDLGRLRGVLTTRQQCGEVIATVRAGTSLGELAAALYARGLVVLGLGTATAPTLAGAIATGTHGGGRHPSLSAQVAGVRVVTADGTLLDIDRTDPRLPAFRLSLGLLGAITRVDLRCVPAHFVELREEEHPLDVLTDRRTDWAQTAEHVSAFWFPWQGRVRLRTLHRVTGPPARHPRAAALRALRDDLLRGWALRSAAARTPLPVSAAERLAELSRPAPPPIRCLPAHRGFVLPQRLRFCALEYAVPLERLPKALHGLHAALLETGFTSPLPLEIRPGPAETTWLSPAHDRATAWINLAAPAAPGRERWLRAAEQVLIASGGRPHWAKQHSIDAAALSDAYPRWQDFHAARRTLDPTGLFLNPHTRRLFGEPAR